MATTAGGRPIEDEVQQILARVPAWRSARDVQVERIAGLTNRNYRVTVDGERYVLRVSGPNTQRLGIDRGHEFAALQSAAVAGIGPEVVAFLLPEGHLVTRWVEGHVWEASEFRTPAHVRLLTETVRRIHALPPNGAAFSPFERIHDYLATARDYGVRVPSELESALDAMDAVQADQRSDPTDWQRLCHNDLAAVNYLYDVQRARIVVLDWEFAGLGDLYYDLATVVYTHDSEGAMPQELEEVMLRQYFGAVTARHRRRLLGMKLMLMLFTGAWGLAQHGMQQAGLIPAVEGFDYLAFARDLFDGEIPALVGRIESGAG